jgi:hypothetical protein
MSDPEKKSGSGNGGLIAVQVLLLLATIGLLAVLIAIAIGVFRISDQLESIVQVTKTITQDLKTSTKNLDNLQDLLFLIRSTFYMRVRVIV